VDEPATPTNTLGPVRTGDKSVSLEVPKNNAGYPVLPPWKEVNGNGWKTSHQQKLLRSYFTLYYRALCVLALCDHI
jgi:hypothetical protein